MFSCQLNIQQLHCSMHGGFKYANLPFIVFIEIIANYSCSLVKDRVVVSEGIFNVLNNIKIIKFIPPPLPQRRSLTVQRRSL